ncbi:MAG: hypothetical protein GY817_00360, partial [bacterium]|nr:hypothetical protein [bacterium]
ATGNYSVRKLAKILQEKGLRTVRGKILLQSRLHEILQNKFYYGYMKHKDNIYPHKYKTIISENLFNKCKAVRQGWHKKPFRYGKKPFIFRGLIKCAYCGCTITSELKKNKYVYLSCTKYRGNCNAVRLKEEEILEQVKASFKKISIPKKILENIRTHLQQSHESKKTFQKEEIRRIDKEYNNLQNKADRLLDIYLEQSITKEDYDKKCTEIKQRQFELAELKKQ